MNGSSQNGGGNNQSPPKTGIDHIAVAEQVLAGAILLALGAAGAHMYDVMKYERGGRGRKR